MAEEKNNRKRTIIILVVVVVIIAIVVTAILVSRNKGITREQKLGRKIQFIKTDKTETEKEG